MDSIYFLRSKRIQKISVKLITQYQLCVQGEEPDFETKPIAALSSDLDGSDEEIMLQYITRICSALHMVLPSTQVDAL